jgi:HSP20 family protein
MTIVRWQPMREMATMQRDLDRLFAGFGDTAATSFVPAAELSTDNDNIYLNLEVPGLTPEEIDVQVSINSVAISGERKQETTTDENGTNRSEFRYGKFHRVIALPKKIQQDAVQAKYDRGVLKLTFPKLEDEKPKTVKIEVAA